MASVNWMKSTTPKAVAMRKHLGQKERENSNHSNEHINKKLSYQNYAIGCNDYSEALRQMKERTKEVDKVIPPKRVRKDRVTCCFLELPCPSILTEQGKSDEFFHKAHQIYQKFFGEDNIHGTFVHKDEIHEYTGKDGQKHLSLEHAHTLVSAFTEEKGINGKTFETRSKIKVLNKAMDDMCIREFGIYLNTGETPQRKSVETLKQESEARQTLGELNKRVGELQKAEQESCNRFLEADLKATEAESRLIEAEKEMKNLETQLTKTEKKLNEANIKYDVATKELKNVLDKKARASEIHKISEIFGETQTYHKNMLESTRAIGDEAYQELREAKQILQKAELLKQQTEQQKKEIEPLHRQAEVELSKAKELHNNQKQEILKKANAITDRRISEIMKHTCSSERDRMAVYMKSLQFSDGTTALERFYNNERELERQLQLQKKKYRGIERWECKIKCVS